MKVTKPLPLQSCYQVAFSKTGELLVTLSRDVVGWSVRRRTKRFRVHSLSHPAHCDIHPSDSDIVVKNTAGQIALLDADQGKLIRMLAQPKRNEGSNILYSPCGEYVVDGSWTGELTVRSTQSGDIAFRKVFPGEMITRVTTTVKGDTWLVVHQPRTMTRDKPPTSAYVSLWNWPFTSPYDHVMSHENAIKAVALSPDAKGLCLVGDDSIGVMSLLSKAFVCLAPYSYSGTQFVATWSPDGQQIATVQENSFVFYVAQTMEKLYSIESSRASDVAYSPDGTLLALGSWNSGVLVNRSDCG
jgi:WD40 repeat protein